MLKNVSTKCNKYRMIYSQPETIMSTIFFNCNKVFSMVDLHTNFALGLEPPHSTHQKHSNHHSRKIKTNSIYLFTYKEIKK